jgi:hypothetical protein
MPEAEAADEWLEPELTFSPTQTIERHAKAGQLSAEKLLEGHLEALGRHHAFGPTAPRTGTPASTSPTPVRVLPHPASPAPGGRLSSILHLRFPPFVPFVSFVVHPAFSSALSVPSVVQPLSPLPAVSL